MLIQTKESDLLETAIELRYKTLFLDKLPIKFKNFSKSLRPDKIINLGVTNVDLGFEILEATTVRILEYTKFRLFEFKRKDFSFSIGVSYEEIYPSESNGNFSYEISKNIKNIRLKHISSMFLNIFNGAKIKFHFSSDKYELSIKSSIESFKFSVINDYLERYENVIENLRLFKYKNLSTNENSFYNIETLYNLLNYTDKNTWINANIKNIYDAKSGDKLILKRAHTINFSKTSYNIVEVIELVQSLNASEIRNGYIYLNRKPVKIKYNEIDKTM